MFPGKDGNFDSLVEAVFQLLELEKPDAHEWIDRALSAQGHVEYAH